MHFLVRTEGMACLRHSELVLWLHVSYMHLLGFVSFLFRLHGWHHVSFSYGAFSHYVSAIFYTSLKAYRFLLGARVIRLYLIKLQVACFKKYAFYALNNLYTAVQEAAVVHTCSIFCSKQSIARRVCFMSVESKSILRDKTPYRHVRGTGVLSALNTEAVDSFEMLVPSY